MVVLCVCSIHQIANDNFLLVGGGFAGLVEGAVVAGEGEEEVDGGVLFLDFVLFGLGDVGDLLGHVDPLAGTTGDFVAGDVEVFEELFLGDARDVEVLFIGFLVGVLDVAFAGAFEVAGKFYPGGDFLDLRLVVVVGVVGAESVGGDVGVLGVPADGHEVGHDSFLDVEG